MLENWDKVQKYADIGANSSGTAMEKYGAVLDSVAAKQEQLTAKSQEFYNNLLNSSVIAGLLDLGKAFMDIMNLGDGLVGKIVLLVAALTALNAIANANILSGFKNILVGIGNNIRAVIMAIPNMITGIKATTAAQEGFNAAAASNPYVAIAEIILIAIMAIVTAINAHNKAIEESIEKANELKNAYADASDEYKNNIAALTETTSEKSAGQKYKDLQEEFDALTKGVDAYGRNLSLSNEEYNRYKTICEQIVELNPDLMNGYDSEIEAIGNKNTALSETIELLKTQARMQSQEYANSSDDILEGSINQYKKEIKDAKNYLDENKRIWDEDRAKTSTSLLMYVQQGLYDTLANDTSDDFYIKISDKISSVFQQLYNMDYDTLAKDWKNVKPLLEDIKQEIFNVDTLDYSYKQNAIEQIDNFFGIIEESYVNDYQSANNTIEDAKEKLSASMSSVYEAVLKSDERYDKLNISTKKFLSDWITNSDAFKIDENTTSEQVDKAKEQIQAMINTIVDSNADSNYVAYLSDGTKLIGQQVFDQLFKIDENKANLTVEEYRQQIEEILRQIVAMVNNIKPEDVTEKQIVKMGDIFGFKMITDGKKGIPWDESDVDDALKEATKELRDEVQRKIDSGEYKQKDVEIIIGLKGNINGDTTISNLDAMITDAQTDASEMIDVFSDYADELQTLSEKYEVLSKAQEEYNEYGNITASTMQKLIKNDLLDYLETENGQLVFNTEKLQENADSLKNNAIANLQASLYTDLNRIALGTYQSAADDVNGDGIVDEVDKQAKAFQGLMESVTSSTDAIIAYGVVSGTDVSGWTEEQKKQAEALYKNYEDYAVKVGDLLSNLASGTYRSKSGSSSSSTNKILSQAKDNIKSLESEIKILDSQIKTLGDIDTFEEYDKQLGFVNQKSVILNRNISAVQQMIAKTSDKETLEYLQEKLWEYKADLANIKDTINSIRLNRLKLQLEDLQKPIDNIDNAIKRLGEVNTLQEKSKQSTLLAQKFRAISNSIATINKLLKDTTLSKDMRELLEKQLQDLLVDKVSIRDDIESNVRESIELEKKNTQLQAELDKKKQLYELEVSLYGKQGKEFYEHSVNEEINRLQKIIDTRNEEKDIQDKITEEQEYQNKLLEAKISLQNALNNKTTKVLTRQEDGTWQYEYSANMADVKQSQEDLKEAQKNYDDWKYEQETDRIQEQIDAIQSEMDEKSKAYEDMEFHLSQSLESQINAIEEYYADIEKLTQDRMDNYQKVYGDAWDKVISIAQTKLDKLSALNTKLEGQSEYAFKTVGTNNTYIKTIQSFDTGGKIGGSGVAFVHDKERVLTEKQNYLFEQMVSKLPQLIKLANITKLAGFGNNNIGGVTNNSDSKKTTIIDKVECIFPNINTTDGLQRAILDLPRLALQTK